MKSLEKMPSNLSPLAYTVASFGIPSYDSDLNRIQSLSCQVGTYSDSTLENVSAPIFSIWIEIQKRIFLEIPPNVFFCNPGVMLWPTGPLIDQINFHFGIGSMHSSKRY